MACLTYYFTHWLLGEERWWFINRRRSIRPSIARWRPNSGSGRHWIKRVYDPSTPPHHARAFRLRIASLRLASRHDAIATETHFQVSTADLDPLPSVPVPDPRISICLGNGGSTARYDTPTLLHLPRSRCGESLVYCNERRLYLSELNQPFTVLIIGHIHMSRPCPCPRYGSAPIMGFDTLSGHFVINAAAGSLS